MESLQNLKSRMRAVSSVKEIAKAMEVVSATKMRKSQEIALRTRPYAFEALALLEKLSSIGDLRHPLFSLRESVEGRAKTLILLIASDRGFAGKFNAEAIKKFENHLKENPASFIIVIGKKAEAHLKRKKIPIYLAFHGFGDFVSPEETLPLSDLIIKGFVDRVWDRVDVIASIFRSAIRQEIILRQVLPLRLSKIRETIDEIIPESGRFSDIREEIILARDGAKDVDYIFEPSASETLEFLIPHLVKMQFYQIILEANASEHSARRVAMKNASDNALELSEELMISYNKARQASITNELIEITGTQSVLL